MSCTASVRTAGSIAVVDLKGKFTFGPGSGVIRGTVSALLEKGYINILLNLAEVVYLDSAAGIGELVSSYATVTRQGGRLKLLRPGKYVLEVLNITRLHTVFELFDDESQALRSFQSAKAFTGAG